MNLLEQIAALAGPGVGPAALAGMFLALVLAGVVKGATGAGAPIVAVPVIAALTDVRLAVIVMATPNLVTNVWQAWHYRASLPADGIAPRFAVGGAAGAILGTFMLVGLPERALSLILAGAVSLYVALRLSRPDLALARPLARRLAGPVGLGGGLLQGASGISAPLSLSYLNAMRMERAEFVALISVFFLAVAAVQVGALLATGLMTPALLGLGLAACVPQIAAMPAGNWLSRYLSREGFDRLVLALLVVLAARLVWSAL